MGRDRQAPVSAGLYLAGGAVLLRAEGRVAAGTGRAAASPGTVSAISDDAFRRLSRPDCLPNGSP